MRFHTWITRKEYPLAVVAVARVRLVPTKSGIQTPIVNGRKNAPAESAAKMAQPTTENGRRHTVYRVSAAAPTTTRSGLRKMSSSIDLRSTCQSAPNDRKLGGRCK